MKTLCLLSAVIFCVFFHAYSVHAQTTEINNRVVAFVNDDLITLHELNSRIREVTGRDPEELKFRDRESFMELRRQVLDNLIDQKLTMAKVRELGVTATPAQVDRSIEKIKKQNKLTQEDLISYIRNMGMTYEQYREKIKSDMERKRLINLEVNSKIIVREEDIEKYYKEHMDDYRIPGKIHIAGIFLKSEESFSGDDGGEDEALVRKAREIYRRVQQGESFSSLADKFSEGPGAGEGGDLGTLKPSQLAPELARVVDGLSPGEVSEPVVRPGGVQIIKLIDRQEGRLRALEEVRDSIYQVFYREEVEKLYSAWIEELRENSYTKIIF